MEEKKFTFKTKSGSWRLFGLLVVIMLFFAFMSNMISTNFYRVTHSRVVMDVRGADLAFEIWRPKNVTSKDKLPAVMISHGGSEMLSCTSLYAWEFARRGYVVINENMNGAGWNGQPAIDAGGYTYGSYSRASDAGHLDILNYVRSITYVDNTRIAVWGHSQGGGTQAAALRLDNGGLSLTLNDRLCNVLYNDYGIVFTEDMLKQNADDIAAKYLTQYQLGEYAQKKVEQEEIYNQTVRFSRNASANGSATVAGIKVTRDAQTNMMPSIGAHEDKGLKDYTRYAKTLRRAADDVQDGGIYYCPDNSIDGNTTSIYLGQIFEVTVQNNPLFAQAVQERAARFLNTPQTIHNGWLWSYNCVSRSVEFMTNCCMYNCGELSDPNTKPISGSNCWLSYSALVCTTLAFFSLMGVLACLCAVIIKSDFFKPCQFARVEARMPLKSKSFWIWVVATAITGYAGEWACSQNDAGFKFSINTMTRIMPWEPGQVKLWWSVIATAVVGVALFFLLNLVTKKMNKDQDPVLAKVKELHVWEGWKHLLKSLLLGVILWVAAYLFAAFIDKFFETRFLHVDGSYETMQWWNFGRLFRYFILYVPFCFVISTLNNMVTIKGVSDSADTAINVLVTSLGMILFMGIGFAVTYSTPGHAEIHHIHAMLATIFVIPAMNYLYRKMYKVTGSPYVGAVIVALFLAWRSAGYLCQRFMWYGNNEIQAFWGIPLL